jgi:hypothetical protein
VDHVSLSQSLLNLTTRQAPRHLFL